MILDADSHAIVVTPNCQSHEFLPLAICGATGVPLDSDDNWSLDIDRIGDAVRPNTRLVTINFPHNPTGTILPIDRYMALVELCRTQGIYILHDEIFHGLVPSGAKHLPFIADVYERGLSLNVVSKSFGLPGLRIGWIACRGSNLVSRMERMKHYLSICNSGPSERLAKIALENREQLLARNCRIVDENLPKWDAFFARHADLFEWRWPKPLSRMAKTVFAVGKVPLSDCCRSAEPCIQLVQDFQPFPRISGGGPCPKAHLHVEFCKGLGRKLLEQLVETDPAMQGQRPEAFVLVVRQTDCQCTHDRLLSRNSPALSILIDGKCRLFRLKSRWFAVTMDSAPPATASSRT